MPKYDVRCQTCGSCFESSRSFDEASAPAVCPHDGDAAIRLFSPPLDLLMDNREPAAPSGRVTIPPGALSCHDHGPPVSPHDDESGRH
ncbi:MAG: hypothetical protein IT306_03080 [Chloroflexi bacterium]|nr:hypothetical protein [Chloroflexota bacterium]